MSLCAHIASVALGTALVVKADDKKYADNKNNDDNDDDPIFLTEGEVEKPKKSLVFSFHKILQFIFGSARQNTPEPDEKEPSKAAEVVKKIKKAVGLEPQPSVRPHVSEARNFRYVCCFTFRESMLNLRLLTLTYLTRHISRVNRENKIYEYEDRLRRYSTPEKVFPD